MNEPTTQGNGDAGNGDAGQTLAPVSLLGTVWRHKKKGGIYRLTQIDNRDNVYLQAETKGCRSTWKYNVLLTWDYEQVPNAKEQTPT